MDCHFCEAIHILGPYVLVVFFTLFISKLVKRHQEQMAQLHGRTLDVFERQTAAYERVHDDLVAIKRDGKDTSDDESPAPKR
ncbi:MAG: hypothetical protein ACLQVI_39865 [Polyangiaceae bacterium]